MTSQINQEIRPYYSWNNIEFSYSETVDLIPISDKTKKIFEACLQAQIKLLTYQLWLFNCYSSTSSAVQSLGSKLKNYCLFWQTTPNNNNEAPATDVIQKQDQKVNALKEEIAQLNKNLQTLREYHSSKVKKLVLIIKKIFLLTLALFLDLLICAYKLTYGNIQIFFHNRKVIAQTNQE